MITKEIEKAIRETLVIDNKQSINIAVNKIAQILADEYGRGYDNGYSDATKEACQEIREHYHPNTQ